MYVYAIQPILWRHRWMLPWICSSIKIQIHSSVVQIPCLAVGIHVLIYHCSFQLSTTISHMWGFVFMESSDGYILYTGMLIDTGPQSITFIDGASRLLSNKRYQIVKHGKFKDFSTVSSMYRETWGLTKPVEPNCRTPRGSTGIIAIVCTSILSEFQEHSKYTVYHSQSKLCSQLTWMPTLNWLFISAATYEVGNKV